MMAAKITQNMVLMRTIRASYEDPPLATTEGEGLPLSRSRFVSPATPTAGQRPATHPMASGTDAAHGPNGIRLERDVWVTINAALTYFDYKTAEGLRAGGPEFQLSRCRG
jgi:hypothetical protein